MSPRRHVTARLRGLGRDWPMTIPYELGRPLVALVRVGVELAAHPTDLARLRYRPASLPVDLLDALTTHREEILAILGSDDGDDPDDEAAYTFGERLGVADGLRLPTHPGSAAWLIATGEALGHAGGRACATRKAG